MPVREDVSTNDNVIRVIDSTTKGNVVSDFGNIKGTKSLF